MTAQSNWSPDRPVEIYANTPPGGGTDRAAQALCQAITANGLLDVPVSVVNAVGKTGNGWCDAGAPKGDAHRVGISSLLLTTDVLAGELPADAMQPTRIAILYTEYLAFVAGADSALRTGADVLNLLSGDTSKVTIALATALGNPNHIAIAEIIAHAGGNVTAPAIRVFNSARLAVADVMEGNADFGVITAASAVPEMKTGSVHTFAVSAPERLHGVFASTPTWREQGVDCTLGSWRGLGGPPGLTGDQIAFWEGVCSAAVKTPEWQQSLEQNLWTELYKDGAGLAQYLEAEYDQTKRVLGTLGMLAA
jgi:putative tricarboxylic transport membrane protein